MSDSTITLIALLVLAIIAVTLGLRIVSDGERFAVYVLGRFSGLKGPGLLWKMPGQTAQWVRLRLGERGEMLGPDMARFGEHDVPVSLESPVRLGSFIRVAGFGKESVRVELDTDQTRTHRCPKCGHEFST
jgi:hypothetical protein